MDWYGCLTTGIHSQLWSHDFAFPNSYPSMLFSPFQCCICAMLTLDWYGLGPGFNGFWSRDGYPTYWCQASCSPLLSPETGFQHVHALQICILCICIYVYLCILVTLEKKIRIYNYNTRKSEVQGNFPTRLVANWEAHTIYNLMLTVQLWLVPGIFTICVWPFKLLVVFRHPSSKYQGGSKTKDVSHFLAFRLCVPSHIWWNPQSVVSKLGKLPPLVHS